MKKKFGPLFLLIIILTAWGCTPTLKKPKYNLLIDDPIISRYPTDYGDSIVKFSTGVVIFNNTDDTLQYTDTWGQDAKYYCTNDKNLLIIDNEYSIEQSISARIIPPHQSRGLIRLYFRFRKIPDTTFKFRIGMRLLKWQNSYKISNPDTKTLQKTDILWSDEDEFKTNKNHRTIDKTPEEYKKQCDKVVDSLSDNDRRNYTLSIDKRGIGCLKDTIAYILDSIVYSKDSIRRFLIKKPFKFVMAPVKLTNNSNKILEYTSWSCSQYEMYQIDTKNAFIASGRCDGNYPVTITVSPHSSSICYIPIFFNKSTPTDRYKFRIGMTVLKADLVQLHGFYWALPIFKRDPKYLIWSNEVTVPVPE